VIDAYGVDRLLWGSDYSKDPARRGYWSHLACLRDSPELSNAEKTAVLGASLRRIFRWET
jgi:predicted TIM-barrel fold metal-dependent hydrolase